jgi:dolichyldiphosphatase
MIFDQDRSLIHFFSIDFSYFLCFRLQHNSPFENVIRGLAIALCSIVTALICYGRIYLLYHTISQVIVGAFIGASFGIFYFLFVHLILTPFVFPRIVSWKISELLFIRDTSLIPNILFFEYTATRQECRARSRKNMKSQ